jgi:predicted transcriptional regulator
MAKRRDGRKLGEMELQIMNVLWDRGPSTVRDVLEALPVQPRPAYTTVLTMMRLMYEKGYLDRREQGRAHVYQAKLREKPTKRTLLESLIDSAFGGSAEALMVRLIEDEKLSPAEIERVKKLIAEHERRGKRDGHR